MLSGEHQSDGIGLEDPHPVVNALIDVSDQESGQLVYARAKRAVRVIREAVQAERLIAALGCITLDLARQNAEFLVRLDILVDLSRRSPERTARHATRGGYPTASNPIPSSLMDQKSVFS